MYYILKMDYHRIKLQFIYRSYEKAITKMKYYLSKGYTLNSFLVKVNIYD